MEDLQRKGDDMDRAVDLSQDLQSLLSVCTVFVGEGGGEPLLDFFGT